MRVGFKMKLHADKENEYKRRHDELWLDLKNLLKQSGIREYSIFHDKETNLLFGVMEVDDKLKTENLALDPIMKKWWTYMRDIMETNEDDSPVSIPLKELFYLK